MKTPAFERQNAALLRRMNELVQQYMADGWLLNCSNVSYGTAELRECMYKGKEEIAIIANQTCDYSDSGVNYFLLEIWPIVDGFISKKAEPLLREYFYIVGYPSRWGSWTLTRDIVFATRAAQKHIERICSERHEDSCASVALTPTKKFADVILQYARQQRGFTQCTIQDISAISCYRHVKGRRPNFGYSVTVKSPSNKSKLSFDWDVNPHSYKSQFVSEYTVIQIQICGGYPCSNVVAHRSFEASEPRSKSVK